MIIEVPDHYVNTLAQSTVNYGAMVIRNRGIVPAFLYQLADTWDKGVKFTHYPKDHTYWNAVGACNLRAYEILQNQGLIK